MTKVKEFIELIEKKILLNKIAIGEKLEPERVLAQKYNFSRQTVHNGLIRLEEKGLVIIKARQGGYVSGYKAVGSLNLLETWIDFDKEIFNEETACGFVDFCRININETIRLCSQEANFDDDEIILNEIKKIEYTEDINKRRELIFEIYRLYATSQKNILYLYLLNSFKVGIENFIFYTAASDQAYYQLYPMLIQVYEYVVTSEEEKAIESNNRVIDYLKSHWK